MLDLMKTIWRRWKGFAHGIIQVQNWILMALAYVIAMTPISIGFRVFSPDPTDRGLGDQEGPSYWLNPGMAREDIRRAQRPW